MKCAQQTEQQVERWLSARVTALQPGEEVYLPPQLRIVRGDRTQMLPACSLARRFGLVPGSVANRWRKPPE